MHTIIGTYEVKTHLSNLLAKVRNGSEFTITHYGTPVAKLVPISRDRGKIDKAISKLKEIRKGCRLNGLKIKDLLNEGRK